MSWLHIDTETSRNAAGSARTSAGSPAPVTTLINLAADSSDLFPADGCGLPLESKKPTPPPCMRTHIGRVAVSDEPTLVPITNVW
jgi:hypothetical protein